MTALPARALAADRRWAAASTRAPGAGVQGTAPKPTDLPTRRGALAWGNKQVPPASNAWSSSSLLSLNNDGGSGSLTNINARPASGGSSGSSTSGSDLLDSPPSCGENLHPVSGLDVSTLHNSTTAISHPRWIDSRSGSLQFSHFQTYFSEALKGPIRSIANQGPTSHGNGFNLSADDFPVLVTKNSVSKSQLGHSSQGQPTFGSGSVATQGEQRKNLTAGSDPVPNANLPIEAQKAQPHGTQAPNITVPPPWLDYWNPPPDHPPDRDGMWHRGAASDGPCKPGNTPGTGSFLVESLTHDDQTLLNQEGEERHGPVHGDYHPENKDPCYAHVPIDVCATSKHHLIPKKDVVLFEKIRCLNIKARNLRARNVSEISSCWESKAEYAKGVDAKTDQVAKDIPCRSITNGIAAACNLANSVSELGNLMLTGPSNVATDRVIVSLSEGHVTESNEGRKFGKSADYHVYGGKSSSRSSFDIATHNFEGWEEHSTVDSLPVLENTRQSPTFPGNSSLQVHGRTASDMLNSPDLEIQHSKSREVPAQHDKQLQEERRKIEPKAKSMAKLEVVNSLSIVHSRKSNDASIKDDKSLWKQKVGGTGTTEHDTSIDTCCIDYAVNRNAPLRENRVKNTIVSINHTPASDTAGVTRGPFIHNVMASAKKPDLNVMQHIAQKSATESNDTIVPKLVLVENTLRRVHSREKILREKSNIAENTEYTTNIARTLVDTRSSVDKAHADLSTQNENRRPVPPHVLCTENTEASSVHKTHTTGVVISSSIIPAQVASVRGFTVGSIFLGDVSLAFVNHEEKTMVKEVHDTVNGCASPQKTMQSEKDQHGVQHAKVPHRNDSVMLTPAEKSSRIKVFEVGRLNCPTIPAPTKRSEMEKLACEEQHLQNLGQIPTAENHTTPYDKSSTSKLETHSCCKEALDTSTATKAKVQTEAGNHTDYLPEKKNRRDKKTSRHSGRSSAPRNEVSSNGLAPIVPKLTTKATNSLLLNVMQELSVKPQQVESKTYVDIEYLAQPTTTVLLPDDTWEMHPAGEYQRQHHVEGQGNLGSNSASYIGSRGMMPDLCTRPPVPMAHLLPQPIFCPQVNALVNGVPGWTWDLDEGVLMSDAENFSVSGSRTTTVDRSSAQLNQSAFNNGQLHGGQVVRNMVYQAANPETLSHAGQEHQQLNPALQLIAQQGGVPHGVTGTAVYWPNMEHADAGMQTHGANYTAGPGPVGGVRRVEYQAVPVASSSLAHGWSQGHPGSNLTVPHWE